MMGRPHRRAIDAEQEYHESCSRFGEPVTELYGRYPPRGRSSGMRRRNRSVPAATATVYDDLQRDPGPRENFREYYEGRRQYRKDVGEDVYAAQFNPRQYSTSYKDRHYHEDQAVPQRAQSHRRDTRELPHARHSHAAEEHSKDFDPYSSPSPSRRGRERQHAHHLPRTSDTRHTNYSDFDASLYQTDKRRFRSTDYYDAAPRDAEPRRPRYREYEHEPCGGRRGRSSNTDHETFPRGRCADYDADHRDPPGNYYASPCRSPFKNDSPDRHVQPDSYRRSARGRSMPRKEAEGGAAESARPRAKSAVGYAALGEAAQTAFKVGSQAALQMRSEPGPWIGEKGTRVATAALGAALVDTFVNHKATGIKGGMRHQALRQALEMGLRNFVVQPTVNTATRRSSSAGGDGQNCHGRRRY